MPAGPPPRLAWHYSAAAGLAALAITLPLTPDVSGGKDAGEFTLVLARFAAAHPTGYPLYTLAGGAFVHALHAGGAHWVWAANAWSAVGGAVAVALLHALAARLLAHEGLAAREAGVGALLPAGALVLHPLWTAATTQAEVHSWHVAWTLGAMLMALAWLSAPAAAAGATSRRALAWGALVGAGLAHHVTSVLTSGPLTLAIAITVVRARAGSWRMLLFALAGAATALLTYGFIAWRAFHPTARQWDALAPNWPSIFAHVTGAAYRIYAGGFAPSDSERALLGRDVHPWLAVLAAPAVAWGVAARRTPLALRLGAAGAFAAAFVFIARYGVNDPSAYFLPPLVLALATAPAGLLLLPGARGAARPLAAVAALAIVTTAVPGLQTTLARTAEYRADAAQVRRLWKAIAADRGFVLWNDDRISVLYGYQVFANERPGLELVYPAELTQDWARAQFVAHHGFDPISKADVEAAAAEVHPRNLEETTTMMAGVIALRINAHSPLPVMMFLPALDTVRVVPKGIAAAPGATPGGR